MKLKLFGIICLMLSLTSCNKDTKNLPENFDFGTTENHTYSNSYFGLSFTYPKDWAVQSKRDIKAITEAGDKILKNETDAIKEAVKASQINIAYLFTLFRHPIKEATRYNASLNLIAENINGLPHVKRGSDYLFHSKNLLVQSRATYTFDDNLSTKTIDGHTFDVMRATARLGSFEVQQEFFCIIRYGFSLSFVLSYTNDEEKRALYQIINSITLD